MRRGSCNLCLAALLAAGGCDPGRPRTVELDVAGVAPAADYGDLAAVLDKAVTSDGLLLPSALKRCADRLDAQLRRLAVTGPTATPALLTTPEERLAYWYNARAAWSMKLALVEDCPEDLSPRVLRESRFPLDGRTMTLAQIDAVLLDDADWRTTAAAPGCCLQTARLPETPFTGRDVRARIARRLQEFLDDADRFVIDVRRRRVRVPPVLWRFRDRLIAEHERTYGVAGATLTTALLPYVTGSPRRRLQDAIGYRVVSARSEGLLAVVKDPF